MYILEVSKGSLHPVLLLGKNTFSREHVANNYQQLARLLDRPLFPWKNVLVGFSLGQFVLEGFLSLRQYKFLQRTTPPKVLEGEVTQKVYDQSQVRMNQLEHRIARAYSLKSYDRHTVAQRPSSVSSQVSTVKSRISLSSTVMSSLRFGV